MLAIVAAARIPENATIMDDPRIVQHLMSKIHAFNNQPSWTPTAISGIVFGVLMFLLGVAALWQTRDQKLIFVGDIESHPCSWDAPCVHTIEPDPDLWVPPYEPPRDFVCIADPPDTYANLSLWLQSSQDPKKPAPKPKPVPQPPQPREGYRLEVDLTDMQHDTESSGLSLTSGQPPRTPTVKSKPSLNTKPSQPGYVIAGMTVDVKEKERWTFAEKGYEQPVMDLESKRHQPVDECCFEPQTLKGNWERLVPLWFIKRYRTARSTLSTLAVGGSYNS